MHLIPTSKLGYLSLKECLIQSNARHIEQSGTLKSRRPEL